MKKILNTIILIASVIIAAGCQKGTEQYLEQLSGDWHYQGTEEGVQKEVWISFADDKTFEMFQKIGSGAYRSVSGHYGIDAKTKVLSGIYDDSYSWKYDYEFKVEANTLVMTAVQLPSYSVTYTRGTIPSQVRQMSIPVVKSQSDDFPRFL